MREAELERGTEMTKPIELGELKLHVLSDGGLRLDGGAMFGVVPRAVWEKTNPPDERNRVALGLNPVLVETPGELVLIDTGVGDKGDEKFNDIYGIERPGTLAGSLGDAGFAPKDVTIVINTHLHFDHAGGNTGLTPAGKLAPVYPGARYVVQAGELSAAQSPNERTRASYRPEDFMPLKEARVLETIDGDGEVTPGVSVFRTGGHNRDIQLVRISSEGRTAVFLTDLIPTATHLSYPFIAGYDLFPLEVLEAKKAVIEGAAEDRWLLLFYHDPLVRAGYVSIEGGKPRLEPAGG